MDKIRFSCQVCGKVLEAPASAAGKRSICPSCKGLTAVPAVAARVPPPTGGLARGGATPAPSPPASGEGAGEPLRLESPPPAPVSEDELPVVRVCSRCGKTIRLGAEHMGKEAKCTNCWATLPPGEEEVIEEMEYPDRPNPLAKVAGWGTSLLIHCLLFLGLTGATWLPSLGTGGAEQPVGILEEDGANKVDVSTPEPVKVVAESKPAPLTPKAEPIQNIPVADIGGPQAEKEVAALKEIGASGGSKPWAAIAVVGGDAGGAMVPGGAATPGGSASSFGGLLANRGGSGKARALAKFGGKEAVPAVQKGLAWLAANQQPDGGWGCPGVTGLALLAFLGDGHTTKQGKYKATVANGCKYLEGNSAQQGETRAVNGDMYHQGIAAFALAEEYAMSKSSYTRELALGALNEVLRCQYPDDGGWRYSHGGRTGGDTSVTGWQVMALKAGKDAGLINPISAFNGARRFLDKVKQDPAGAGFMRPRFNRGQSEQHTGGEMAGFGYTSPGSTPTLSAVGLVCLQFMRCPEYPLMHKVARFLMQMPPDADRPPTNLYGLYYATIGVFQMGGNYWTAWNEPMKKSLINSQNPDGHWECAEGGGNLPNAYRTALAVLTLEVYYRYVPLGIK